VNVIDPRTLDAWRARLPGTGEPHYWRALEELQQQPEFRRCLREALPQLAGLEPCMDRRGFLKLLGASLAMAGLTACSGPAPEHIVPWVQQPEGRPSSLPQFYATTLRCADDVAGVLVETHQGRPGKIEGNPDHPASLGATDARMQAAVLELWDPDRSQAPMHRGDVASWDAFLDGVPALVQRFGTHGKGLHVLSGRIDSPTLKLQRAQWLAAFPGASWHLYEAVDDDAAIAGSVLAFGHPMRVCPRIDKAAVIVSLEADFLADMPGHLRHARDFAAQRKPVGNVARMNRLYAIEATPSLTGANADHAWPLASGRIGDVLLELAVALDIPGVHAARPSGISTRRVHALADDLRAHLGASLLLAGRSQPAHVHALVHLINQVLGNAGRTIGYRPFDDDRDATSSMDALRSLAASMARGDVDTLLILDGNPAYAAPKDVHFAGLLKSVRHSIHVGLHHDETAALCDWHLPRTHALEEWSDAMAFDGTASIVQPVIAPLYGGRSIHELLAMLMGRSVRDGRSIVRATWQDAPGGRDDDAWQDSLRRGVVASSPDDGLSVPVARGDFLAAWPSREQDTGELELLFRPDPSVWDGRYANNAWLQELPRTLTQLSWANAALISPALASTHGLTGGDVIELLIGERHVDAPVWVLPGQAEHSVTLPLGYGRERAGHVGDSVGFDAFAMRTTDAPWREGGLRMRATGRRVELASTQQHHAMEERAPVRVATLARFLATPDVAQRGNAEPPTLYPDRAPGEYRWGMTVDLNSCIGCNACSIACQAENNIPVVGDAEVKRGREMHWIRVDRYYEGSPEAPRTYHQPVPCMHCEHAPCEVVCPVGATVHDSEGLNLQVYNRCVGTRFCSNNCPYKVRRFNFLQYSDLDSRTLKAQRNPDVSVRNRGVMEKCTYCIQRVETAHIAADIDGRRIADGEVVTACQAVCPTRAITFGDMADAATAVSREKASPRNYSLLEELNTRPHTTYLAALRNPNPALEDDA
jgi:MoCo/4Fe-4S cofactor protein with predicted Tat translocation signal